MSNLEYKLYSAFFITISLLVAGGYIIVHKHMDKVYKEMNTELANIQCTGEVNKSCTKK